MNYVPEEWDLHIGTAQTKGDEVVTGGRTVRVIEKSAYEAVVQECSRLLKAYDDKVKIGLEFQSLIHRLEPEIARLARENDDLRAELTRLRGLQN